MPFTPLHMGPAALIKSAAGRHFSLVTYGLTQVFIDLESGSNMLLGNWPIHTHLHSLLGASLAAVICTLVGKPLTEWLLGFWNRRLSEDQQHWFGIEPRISWLAAASGAWLGAGSHVLLDSMMHSDLRPGAPFSDANPMLHWVSIPTLHLICVVSGMIGLLLMVPGWWHRRFGQRHH